MKRLLRALLPVTLPLLGLLQAQATLAQSTAQLLDSLRTIESSDASNKQATKTLAQLKSAADLDLISTLKAMKGATPVGRNWLMGLANRLAVKSLPKASNDLQRFLEDVSQDGEARYAVFQWLTKSDPSLRAGLLQKMKQDPSPELRYLAVKELIDARPDPAELKNILEVARHPEQVTSIIATLKEKGTEVDQAKHFGFLMNWILIGPFDNVGTVHFDKAFSVEADWIAGSVKDSYPGKSGDVVWQDETTSNPEGVVDLAAIYKNEKGCIVYAMAEFDSPQAQDAELRLGCINGNKAWLNGKLVISNEVYHSSMQIDQYNEKVKLLAGKNRILVKICQNEQTEQWAQRFAFQLRVSDSTGKALLAKGR
jgi:hypothetical protein